MKTYTLVCSGYSTAKEADMLVVQLNEKGEYRIIDTYRQGENPSFGLRAGSYFYTAEEVGPGGGIRAWKIQGDKLEETDMRIEVPGGALCHLYAGEQALFGSCYMTGDYFAVDYELKKILWHQTPRAFADRPNARQECPHAHWTACNGEELFLADLGSDRIWRHKMENGLPVQELPALELDRGAGPRQPLPLECTGEDRYLLTIQELDSTLWLWKKNGEKYECVDKIRSTAKDCDNFPGTICMVKDDTVLVCNRGSNTISAVEIKEDKLKLSGEWETGNWPRHLIRVADSNLFVNSCDRSGEFVIFAWENEQLAKKSVISLHGASCAALL